MRLETVASRSVSTVLTAGDSEGNTLMWIISLDPSAGRMELLNTIGSTVTAVYHPDFSMPGEYIVRIAVADGFSQDSILLQIKVTAAPPIPIFLGSNRISTNSIMFTNLPNESGTFQLSADRPFPEALLLWQIDRSPIPAKLNFQTNPLADSVIVEYLSAPVSGLTSGRISVSVAGAAVSRNYFDFFLDTDDPPEIDRSPIITSIVSPTAIVQNVTGHIFIEATDTDTPSHDLRWRIIRQIGGQSTDTTMIDTANEYFSLNPISGTTTNLTYRIKKAGESSIHVVIRDRNNDDDIMIRFISHGNQPPLFKSIISPSTILFLTSTGGTGVDQELRVNTTTALTFTANDVDENNSSLTWTVEASMGTVALSHINGDRTEVHYTAPLTIASTPSVTATITVRLSDAANTIVYRVPVVLKSIDMDSNGLIDLIDDNEIHYMRHDLTGASYRQNDSIAGATHGCPNDLCVGYELKKSIHLDEIWRPIGSQTTPFSAHFHGGGHTISNLTIRSSSTDYVGFFARVSTGSVISSVTFSVKQVVGRNYTGALAGEIIASTVNDIVFIPHDNLQTYEVLGAGYVGGIAGRLADNAIVQDVSTELSVLGNHTALGDNIGGAIGLMEGNAYPSDSTGDTFIQIWRDIGGTVANTYVRNVRNIGQVRSGINDISGGTQSRTAHNVGGLIGQQNGGALEKSVATGDVIGNNGSTSTVVLARGYGGLIGKLTGGGIVLRSRAAGDVRSIGNHRLSDIGGLIGVHEKGLVWQVHAAGTVHGKRNPVLFGDIPAYAPDDNLAGLIGLLGTQDQRIYQAYATGDINGHFSSTPYVSANPISGLIAHAASAEAYMTQVYFGGDIFVFEHQTGYSEGLIGNVGTTVTHATLSGINYFRNSTSTTDDGIGGMFTPSTSVTQAVYGLTFDELQQVTGESPQMSMPLLSGWESGFDFDGDGVLETSSGGDDLYSLYCDANGNGQIDMSEENSTNRVWNFGSSNDLPHISCLPPL